MIDIWENYNSDSDREGAGEQKGETKKRCTIKSLDNAIKATETQFRKGSKEFLSHFSNTSFHAFITDKNWNPKGPLSLGCSLFPSPLFLFFIISIYNV